VNNSVYQDSKISEVFSTLSVVVLDNKEMILNYSGAGDLPIFYKKIGDRIVTKIESKGLLLGFNNDSSFEDTRIKMNKDEIVFLTTDGIIESVNIDGKQLGSKGLAEIIKNIGKGDSSINFIKDQITSFTSEHFDDDISLVMISAKI
jgi:sigma-B regulation protein RsbU (phosphoserine phosphatase)